MAGAADLTGPVAGHHRIWLRAALLALLLPGAVAGQTDSAFVAWARTRAHPYPGAEALAALAPRLERARLIGLGESVHEIHEFLGLRQSLLEDLVSHHRVTAVLLESGLPEALNLEDYVSGRVDTVDFDAVLNYGNGRLGPVRDALRWIRDWNLGPGRAHPVRVIGVDLAGSAGSMVPALDRLDAAAPAGSPVRSTIATLRPLAVRTSGAFWRPAAARYDSLGQAARDSLRRGVVQLVADARRTSNAANDPAGLIVRLALVAEQTELMLRLGALHPDNARDRAMAANTIWALDQLGPGERAVLWAHNAHVQRVRIKGPPAPRGAALSMGSILGAQLGDRYLAIGTAYGGASVDSATAPAEGSVDEVLGRVAAGPFLLPLIAAPATGPVAAWLAAERPIRFQVGHLLVPLGGAFDAMVYFDRASPARRVSP